MPEYAEKRYGETEYGLMSEEGQKPEQQVDLMKYLPLYWHEIKEMKALQASLGKEAELHQTAVSETEDQLHLGTATWGLTYWEKDYGLLSDTEKSNEFRRERLRAKRRGTGTTTKQQIINIASAFAGGEAVVLEKPAESRFTVKFIGLKGVPGNMADLTAAIEEIKPAHLDFDYQYTYNWWDTLSTQTWNSLNTSTWNQVKTI